ncbi:cytochrome c biogenesis heme-transporting ATPase CcmA [Endozoicomonas sp. SCSIO W0465]|uniref:cytochrome c biogenesis heme-transporting ATPase CcmA n=1 Tax=Endozoicomonas sp. SCSIO W0465 TaxID=2918516 RepID=UPI002075E4A8|nr:cytochrome c biogenesis heme-transporting ATPase CcmA [Endozoicomonas sp. SCSIO W0465]USE39671.1 cytochrome c biogenesis heme-transporting ATPase CcmA [Endozoicomonas sp. SCSIO W0465]
MVQLSCERDDRLLFSNVSFQLGSGEILQIEGRNGAGKTSLLRIIAGFSSSLSGDVFWNGQLLSKVYADFRHNCFFLGHTPGLKLDLTPLENLIWRAKLANTMVNREGLLSALERVQLADYEDIPCSNLSAGQLRRVAFAGLIASKSRLWILDEPFTAIDIEGVSWLESLFDEHLHQAGMVLVTSHQPLNDRRKKLRKLNLEHFAEQGDADEKLADDPGMLNVER